jgi:hypothetical protein
MMVHTRADAEPMPWRPWGGRPSPGRDPALPIGRYGASIAGCPDTGPGRAWRADDAVVAQVGLAMVGDIGNIIDSRPDNSPPTQASRATNTSSATSTTPSGPLRTFGDPRFHGEYRTTRQNDTAPGGAAHADRQVGDQRDGIDIVRSRRLPQGRRLASSLFRDPGVSESVVGEFLADGEGRAR